MKKLTFMMAMFLLMLAGSATAQEERGLTKAEKKALQERIDSLLFVEAEQAINDRAFTLEADQVIFKRLARPKSCRALYVCVGFSESLRICLQSSYSRPCGEYRRLPSCQTYLARGQVPL